MKKIGIIISTLLIVLLGSCTDNEIVKKYKNVRITASVPDSRTLFSEEGNMTNVVWEIDDEIGLMTSTQVNLKYKALNNGKTTEFEPVGEGLDVMEGDSVFAYYPFVDDACMDSIGVNNEWQYYKENGNRKNLFVAKGKVENGKLELNFQHLFAYMKIIIPTDRFPETWNGRLIISSIYETFSEVGYRSLSANFYNSEKGIFGDKSGSLSYMFRSDDIKEKQEVICYIAILPQDEDAKISISLWQGEKLLEQAVPDGGFKVGNVYELRLDNRLELEDAKAKERAALIEFYKAANGDGWHDNTNWCSDKPLGEWYGINTFAAGERVSSINLGLNGIKGDIATCIEALLPLKCLELLWLELNGLSGEIPECIGEFRSLESLKLGMNRLSGKLPDSMSDLKHLRSLDLGFNDLSGNILCLNPVALNMEVLDLRDNNFTGELLDMSKKMVMYTLSGNSFLGNIPKSHINAFDGDDSKGGVRNEYGIWYEIFGNNLSGEILDDFKSHKNWFAHWENILPQNEGYGFDRVDKLPIPKNTVKCYDDSFLNLGEEYAKNEYTIIFRTVAPSIDYIAPVCNLYKKYKKKGLGVLCTTFDKKDQKDIIPLKNLLPDVKMFWEYKAERTDDTYENNPYRNSSLFGHDFAPYYMVVDKEGNLLFSAAYYTNKGTYSQYHSNPLEIYDFVANLFGDKEYEQDEELYTSTDYSNDGQILTLQEATEGLGINLTFMGEGFVDKDMLADGLYEQKMEEAMEMFFSMEPYKSLRNRFNVYAVKVVSPNPGFTEEAKHRINANDSICFEYASKIPDADKHSLMVSVIYNTDTSVGRSYTTMYSDGSYVAYMMEGVNEVLIHESGGHGFANLLDEYVEPVYQSLSLPEGECSFLDEVWTKYAWGANVDWKNDSTAVKWAHLLNDTRYAGEGIGLYEGAYLYGYGAYRPTENSMMRYGDTPFNAPSREQIYKRIMSLSKGKGWKYDYEEFVKFDESCKYSESRTMFNVLSDFERKHYSKKHRRPIYVKCSWRNVLKK